MWVVRRNQNTTAAPAEPVKSLDNTGDTFTSSPASFDENVLRRVRGDERPLLVVMGPVGLAGLPVPIL